MMERMSIEQLETIADEFGVRPQLGQTWRHRDLIIQLIGAALLKGVLTAYALRLGTNSAFQLSKAWWQDDISHHNIEQSIENGILAISRTLFDEQTPQWEVAKSAASRAEKAGRSVSRTPPAE